MRIGSLALRNLRRTPVRAVLTVLAVAISLVAVVVLRAVKAGYTDQVEQTPNNRVVSRHRVGWSQSLPIHYVDDVRGIEGVKHAMGGRFAGLKHPDPSKKYFPSMAVQARPFIDMHYEISAPEEQKRAFVAQRNAALVSVELAREFGWKLGDTVQLKGTNFPGMFQLGIAGIYQSTRRGFAARTVWMHWEYLNEKVSENQRDKINLISAEIVDPSRGATIARAVDIHFDDRDDQTLTQEDQALNASFIGMFAAILQAIDGISLLILGVVVLILGNTVAMSVRERTQEYGVLRAIGFTPNQLAGFVLLEATALGLLGGAVGLGLAYPLVEGPVSRYLKESVDLAQLHVPNDAALAAFALAGLLAAASAAVPAFRVTRLGVVEALRKVD